MNRKLIFRLSFLPCLVFNLLMVIALKTAHPDLIYWLFSIILILCAFILPAWVIAKKVHSRRFMHGFMVGIIGWSIGFLVLIFPGSIVFETLMPSLYSSDPAGMGQALGIGGAAIWLLGLISSPVIGFFSWLAGKIFDKKTMMQNSKTISKDKL